MNTHQFNALDSKIELQLPPIAFVPNKSKIFLENEHYLKCFDNPLE